MHIISRYTCFLHCRQSSKKDLSCRWAILLEQCSTIEVDSTEVLDIVNCTAAQVMHGDLKSRNVLLTRARTAKIADIGLARIVDPGSQASSEQWT